MFYSCYGLIIQSDLALPELIGLETEPDTPSDVTITLDEVSAAGLCDGKQLGPYLWVSDTALWLEVPHVARFLVVDGQRIVIQPASGIDEDSVRVFLLGSGMGALLFQRGLLVLHGNAIRIGDQCMICVGHSGAGKSALAAGFLKRGYDILADDVAPIDSNVRALPGFPRIKLWQDTANRLGVDTAGLRRIRPELEKFNYPLNNRFTDRPLPVRWIYLLGTHRDPDIHFETISGFERFSPLLENTYRVQFLQSLPLKATHMKNCCDLAGRIHLSRVTRPDYGFSLDALIDGILVDIEANP